jgi:rubrerythrin
MECQYYIQTLDRYTQILEKTNQQLGLWTNPYGLMVGSLAVLFTVLAIVATFLIYRQGREYKEKMQADRDNYKKSFEDFIASQKLIIDKREKQAEEVESKINKLIDEYKKDLDKSSIEQKKDIEKAIKRLEEEKISLNKTIGPLTVSPNSIGLDMCDNQFVAGLDNYHKCSKCGYGFFVKNNDFSSIVTLAYLGGKTITCPKCGNVDRI